MSSQPPALMKQDAINFDRIDDHGPQTYEQSYELTVEEMRGRKITRVHIRPSAATPDTDPGRGAAE